MIKIAICDDLEDCRRDLSRFIAEYSRAHPDLQIDCSVYDYGENLIATACKIGGFDIYLLDIVMPVISGIELGSALRENGYDGKILYLTSSQEYAIESFKVKPFNYILKPIDKDKIFSALDEVITALSSKKEKSIIVKTKENSIRISLDDIMYAEHCKRTIIYHLTNGKTIESILLRSAFLENIGDLLRDGRFVACGISMVANLHHITMVEKDTVIFKEQYKYYLSKKVCAVVRSAWQDFWFGEENQ